jgi:hypothetical protein
MMPSNASSTYSCDPIPRLYPADKLGSSLRDGPDCRGQCRSGRTFIQRSNAGEGRHNSRKRDSQLATSSRQLLSLPWGFPPKQTQFDAGRNRFRRCQSRARFHKLSFAIEFLEIWQYITVEFSLTILFID